MAPLGAIHPMVPMASYGALVMPPVPLGQEPPARQLSSGEKFFFYGVGTLLLVGIGYAFYKRMQVYEHIAKTEGSSGALKLAAGEAAIGVASDWLSPTRSSYRRNLKRRRRLKPRD